MQFSEEFLSNKESQELEVEQYLRKELNPEELEQECQPQTLV